MVLANQHPHRNNVAQTALEAAQTHHGQPISPRNIYVIGDTPSDILYAQAIGTQSVAVATGVFSIVELQKRSPNLLVADLSDLNQFIANLRLPSTEPLNKN